MFIPIRILMVIMMFGALHLHYNLREKTLQDKVFRSILVIYLVHVSFIFPLYLVGIEKYSYIDRAAPFSLFYGPALYFLYRAMVENTTLPMKEIIKHSIPIILFWMLYFVFVLDEDFRNRIQSWYYFLVYGAIGFSLVTYSIYIIVVGRKFRIMVSKINYFAWYSILSGTFMLTFTVTLIKSDKQISEIHTTESSAVTVAIFMCLGVMILFGESFNRFKEQYFPPSLLRQPVQRTKCDETSECKRTTSFFSSHEILDKEYKELESFFASEKICNPLLNTKDAASALKITQKALNQNIQAYYNTTFSKVIISKRIDLACNLLRSKNSKSELNSLAAECGFGSKATFYRNFQKLKGCTPSQFRDRYYHKISSSKSMINDL